jgi:protein CpxP
MKKRTIAILTVAAVLVIGGVFAIAQRAAHIGFGGHGIRGGQEAMMMLKRLDLTSDQQAKVKDIFEANKGTVQPIFAELKANHEKLAALGGSFDEGQVTAIAKEQGELMSQLIVARQKVKSQIYAILTDDQKARAEQLQQEMKQRFHNRMKSAGGDSEKTEE